MEIVLEVLGDVELARKLVRFAGRANNVRPVLESLAHDFLSIERAQFKSEGARGSGGWAPLAPSTVAKRGSAHPILFETGALYDSLTKPGNKGAVRNITADGMTVGTTVPYARFHQHGTGRMPRRRPVEFTEADRRAWVKAIQRFIVYDGRV